MTTTDKPDSIPGEGGEQDTIPATTTVSELGIGEHAGQIINIPEVEALIQYASEKGIAADDRLLANLLEDVTKFRENSKLQDAQSLLENYAKLCRLTEPVSGRNIIGVKNLSQETRKFNISSLAIFLISISLLATGLWVIDETPADDGYLGVPIDVIQHCLPFATPFFWGALGSCVYILKRINDEAAALAFDPVMFKGWITRVLLGAILGGSITYVIDPEVTEAVKVSTTALAFLAGLGTKAVYGGLEKIIQLLVEKMNLKSLKQQNKAADAVAEFLAKEIAATDPKAEADKYEALVDLLKART